MTAAMADCWVGIDTGGTFTDVVLVDRGTGAYHFRKVPSDPSDPPGAILRGLDEILADAHVAGARVALVGLGTTLPMVRISRAGVIEDDIFDIIRLNSRTPDERVGDLQAQIAACRVGAERISGLFHRHGITTVSACIAHFLEATGKRFAAAVQALPDGEYESEEFLDPTGTDAGVRLHLRLPRASCISIFPRPPHN